MNNAPFTQCVIQLYQVMMLVNGDVMFVIQLITTIYQVSGIGQVDGTTIRRKIR
ncbi:hypothetical protein D3C81_2175040 [compost metagenome]